MKLKWEFWNWLNKSVVYIQMWNGMVNSETVSKLLNGQHVEGVF